MSYWSNSHRFSTIRLISRNTHTFAAFKSGKRIINTPVDSLIPLSYNEFCINGLLFTKTPAQSLILQVVICKQVFIENFHKKSFIP